MNIVDLDVRHILKAKGNPLKLILQTADDLGPCRVLQLHTPFKPSPLYRVMAKRGYAHTTIVVEKGHFVTQFYATTFGEALFFVSPDWTQVDKMCEDVLPLFKATQQEQEKPTLVFPVSADLHSFVAQLENILHNQSFQCQLKEDRASGESIAWVLVRPETDALIGGVSQ